jgi:hypothetical protein
MKTFEQSDEQRVRQRKIEAYLRDCEQIQQARIKLRMTHLQISIGPHGNVEQRFPDRVQAVDDEYVRMIELLQAMHFGTTINVRKQGAA